MLTLGHWLEEAADFVTQVIDTEKEIPVVVGVL